MITWFNGENSFAIGQAVTALADAFDGRAEKIDGTTIELKHIPDLLMGSTLFADKRLVIIKDLSLNAAIWEKMPEWIDRLSDDIKLVLIDTKPDKRTTIYKEVKKRALLTEFPVWGDRDQPLAESWLVLRAQTLGLNLDKRIAHHIVNRVGMNQWELANSLDKISLLDVVTVEIIDAIIEANPTENVFQLFEFALDGRRKEVHNMIRTLELSEDPYRLFALLSSQAFQLAAVASAAGSDNSSKDFAIHPFVASKLMRHGKRLGQRGTAHILAVFAQADADMKRSKGEPWLL
ncbi:DNA polymerase III subunit delta, partial [Candidatus Saccharibacteria bacterium]|nr:DNA polymerase III subunit delta [Candidatus Saccharibacteria bacterium]